jgi:hypothetical protein
MLFSEVIIIEYEIINMFIMLLELFIMVIMGIFWEVDMRIIDIQFMFSMIDIDHRWNGGRLIFIIMGRLIIIIILLFVLFMDMDIDCVIIIIDDDKAWMMKNLIDDSLNFLFIMIGIIVMELISIIVQFMNQLLVDIIIKEVEIFIVIIMMIIRKKIYYF